MSNTFTWLQLLSDNPKKSQDFYGKLFNWNMSTQPIEGGSHTTIDAGNGSFGGITQVDKSMPPQWISYISVDDIKTYTEKAKTLGAEIVFPVTEIGGDQGFYSIIKDPDGAILGLWGPK